MTDNNESVRDVDGEGKAIKMAKTSKSTNYKIKLIPFSEMFDMYATLRPEPTVRTTRYIPNTYFVGILSNAIAHAIFRSQGFSKPREISEGHIQFYMAHICMYAIFKCILQTTFSESIYSIIVRYDRLGIKHRKIPIQLQSWFNALGFFEMDNPPRNFEPTLPKFIGSDALANGFYGPEGIHHLPNFTSIALKSLLFTRDNTVTNAQRNVTDYRGNVITTSPYGRSTLAMRLDFHIPFAGCLNRSDYKENVSTSGNTSSCIYSMRNIN